MKTCPYCGHEMNEKDNLCIRCGNQVNDESTFTNEFSDPQPPMQEPVIQNLPIDQLLQSQQNQSLPQLQPVPPFLQPIPEQQNFTPAPKEKKQLTDEQKRNILKYGGIALGIIVLILLIVLIFNLVASKDTKRTTSSGEDIKLKEDEQPDEEKEYMDNAYEFNYGDFIYYIPNDYKATSLQNGALDLTSSTNEKEILISITKGDFKAVNNNHEQVKKSYENKGLTINKIASQLLNNQDYIILEAKNRDMQMLISLTSKEEGIIHVITVYNKSNEYDYNLLYEAANIIKYMKSKEKTA